MNRMKKFTKCHIKPKIFLFKCSLIVYNRIQKKERRQTEMKITNLQTGDIYFGEKDQILIDVLNQNNLFITAPCGGKGICGKCKLQLLPADTPVSPQDIKLLKIGRAHV